MLVQALRRSHCWLAPPQSSAKKPDANNANRGNTMTRAILTAVFSLAALPALANGAPVPEMDAGAGIAAIALLAGAAAIIRERAKKK